MAPSECFEGGTRLRVRENDEVAEERKTTHQTRFLKSWFTRMFVEGLGSFLSLLKVVETEFEAPKTPKHIYKKKMSIA